MIARGRQPRQGKAQIPPLQIPEAQTLPQLPQFLGSDRMSPAQYAPDADRQTWAGGQQSGGTPGGGILKVVVLSATMPGGQQSAGWRL